MAPSLLDFAVFVTSKGRHERCPTLDALIGHWERTSLALVVPRAEVGRYSPLARRRRVALLGSPHTGFGATRHWIAQQAPERFAIVDDDVSFLRRAQGGTLHRFGRYDAGHMLLTASRMLDYYAHLTISGTGGRPAYPLAEFETPQHFYAYRRDAFLSVEHPAPVGTFAPLDTALRLVLDGRRLGVLTDYAAKPLARTKAERTEFAGILADEHPKYVGLLLDDWPVIDWQKAYRDALRGIT